MTATIHFACGAQAVSEEGIVPLNPRTKRVDRFMVWVCKEGQNPDGPRHPDGTRANCLWNCPARVRESKRKEFEAWIGEAAKVPNGEPVRCVSCQPTGVVWGVEEEARRQVAGGKSGDESPQSKGEEV